MALKILSFSYVLFILLLIVSSFFEGALGLLIYFLAFAIPFSLSIFLGRRSGELEKPKLKISKENFILMLPTLIPVILITIGLSALFSFIFGLFGFYNNNVTDVSGNIIFVLIRHAVLPTVLEELLFRYLPIALLAKSSPRMAIFASGVFFAFSHCNLFQLPYALFAGLIFAMLDVIFNSITPSLILHFLNNVISVFYLRYSEIAVFKFVYYITLSSVALISLIIVFLLRNKYLSKVRELKNENEGLKFGAETLIFLIITSAIAIITI